MARMALNTHHKAKIIIKPNITMSVIYSAPSREAQGYEEEQEFI